MNIYIKYILERNHYFEKYHSLNEREINKFESGNFSGIDTLYENRQAILDIIDVIEQRMNDSTLELPSSIDAETKSELSSLLSYKDELLKRILEQDIHIMALIETEKNNIINELAESKSGRKAVSAYKSGRRKNSLNKEL